LLPKQCIEKINAVFKRHPAINLVILYGSRAQGNYRISSDIDLCIEGKDLNLSELLKIETELDDLLLPWKIDLSLKHKIDNLTLLAHIQQVGLLFYPMVSPCGFKSGNTEPTSDKN
jgi:predicted nucleotidyltransferase